VHRTAQYPLPCTRRANAPSNRQRASSFARVPGSTLGNHRITGAVRHQRASTASVRLSCLTVVCLKDARLTAAQRLPADSHRAAVAVVCQGLTRVPVWKKSETRARHGSCHGRGLRGGECSLEFPKWRAGGFRRVFLPMPCPCQPVLPVCAGAPAPRGSLSRTSRVSQGCRGDDVLVIVTRSSSSTSPSTAPAPLPSAFLSPFVAQANPDLTRFPCGSDFGTAGVLRRR